LKRLLSADLPTPYFLAAGDIDRPFEELESAIAVSIEVLFVEVSRVYCGVSRARCLCAWCVCARGGERF